MCVCGGGGVCGGVCGVVCVREGMLVMSGCYTPSSLFNTT